MRRIAVLACALSLVWTTAPAPAQAEEVTPLEGSWTATTSAGLPVSFEVTAGQVVNARFKFRWGFCGVFESAERKSVPIEAGGRWKYPDPRGPWIEGTFVAGDRAEGTVHAPSRMLPGCPETAASFTAAPGEPDSAPEPEARVTDDITGNHLARRPHKIVLTADGSFYLRALRWQGFGGRVARATGSAYARNGCMTCADREVKRPRVRLRLTDLTPRGRYAVYGRLHYVLLGPLPEGFARRGSLSLPWS